MGWQELAGAVSDKHTDLKYISIVWGKEVTNAIAYITLVCVAEAGSDKGTKLQCFSIVWQWLTVTHQLVIQQCWKT